MLFQTIVTGAGDETLRFWNVFPSAKSQVNDSLDEFKIFGRFDAFIWGPKFGLPPDASLSVHVEIRHLKKCFSPPSPPIAFSTHPLVRYSNYFLDRSVDEYFVLVVLLFGGKWPVHLYVVPI